MSVFRSKTCRFRDTALLKIGNTPNEPRVTELFNFTRILYSLNTHLRGRNVTPFCSLNSRFPDTRLSKIGNAPKEPQNDLNHLSVKSTLYTLNTHPEA